MSRELPSSFSLLLDNVNEETTPDEETTSLFHTFASRLKRWLGRRFGDGVAQDATQEAFLRLHRAHNLGTHIKNPKAWLARVARHVAIDQTRRSTLDRSSASTIALVVGAGQPDGHETPEEIFWRRQRVEKLKQEIAKLSDLERTCLFARAEGQTFSQIGKSVAMDFRRVAELVDRVIKKLRAACDADPT